jgi:polyisoprenyl-teichoic acid--peptidoglycan teichoic acid transferase
MKRRAVLAIFGLTAWVLGSALGALGPVTAHAQVAGVAVGKAHAGYTPSLTGSKPVVILAVGSGARPGDDVLHSLADSIHLIFINPAKHHATMVGIPRDSYVDVPGQGTNKINSSLFFGGPELLVQTVESISGVHIDYWAITTFWGFTDMINEIGGLTVDVPFRFYDPSYSRADLQPGVQTLDGQQALSFARDRHSMVQGDFARQENGGRLFLAALTQFQKAYAKDAAQLMTWLGAGMSNTFIEIPMSEVQQLAFTATKIPVKNVQNVVLPGSAQMAGSLSVVILDNTWKTRIFTDVKPDAILSKKNVPPSPTADQPTG